EEGAEGAVDVEPETLLGAELGDLRDRIAGAGVDRARLRDHQRRLDARGAVAADRLREQVDAQGVVLVDRDSANAARAEPEGAKRLVIREVQLLAAVDGE